MSFWCYIVGARIARPCKNVKIALVYVVLRWFMLGSRTRNARPYTQNPQFLRIFYRNLFLSDCHKIITRPLDFYFVLMYNRIKRRAVKQILDNRPVIKSYQCVIASIAKQSSIAILK